MIVLRVSPLFIMSPLIRHAFGVTRSITAFGSVFQPLISLVFPYEYEYIGSTNPERMNNEISSLPHFPVSVLYVTTLIFC